MITLENVTLYKCEYCSKNNRRKHVIEKHEKFCPHNPNNHHKCFKYCLHLRMENVDSSGAPIDLSVIYKCPRVEFSCAVLGKKLHSYKAEKMGLTRKYPNDFKDTERMPLECGSYEKPPSNPMF